MPTCLVTGTAISPDGTALANGVLRFFRTPSEVVSVDGVVVFPTPVVAVTSDTGAISVELTPGTYRIQEDVSGVAFTATVPDDLPTVDWAYLLTAAAIVAIPDVVQQVFDARDEAVAAAEAAAGGGGGNGVLYIIPAEAMAAPHAAITAALAAYDRVMIPAGTWAVNSTIVMATGKTLTAAPGCTITTTAAQIITMTGVSKARAVGLSITGPNTGTSYQVILTDCTDCEVDISIRNGNSGVHLVRSDFCKVRADLREMRGAGIRLSGAQNNDIRLVSGRNIGGFGVYLALDGSRISTKNRIGAEKYCDPATLTAFLLASDDYSAATGRIGLEAVGITVGNDGNIIDGVFARDTGDNGISITSNENSGGNFVIENCDHDGLHVYGSYNSFSSVTARGNRFSGLGISQSSTTGTASCNSVVGLVSEGNAQYGVELGDIADKNFVIAAIGENTLGASSDTSSGSNNLGLAGGVAVQSASAQVSFVGVSDLSPSYGVRTAYFRHADYYCDFWLSLRFTPTYTVPGSPGEFRISVPGLPSSFSTAGLLVSGVAGLSWPAGATQITARFESGAVVRIRAQGPTLDAMSLSTDHFPVGQQVSLTISGRYQTADAGGSGGGGGGGGGASAWGDITGTPTTLLGYGITDAQPLAAVLTGTTASFTTAQESKLAGIATAATANATDAALRDRSSHTGTQAAATITGLATVATSGAFADLTGKPTTLAGYGITDDVEQPVLVPLTLDWVANGFATSTAALAANGHVQGFWAVPYDITITDVGINVTTAGSAGATAKVAIYSATGSNRPDAILAESPDMAVTSTGVKTVTLTVPLALTKGQVVWIGVRASAAVTVTSATGGNTPGMALMTTPTTASRASVSRSATYGSATQSPWVWSNAEVSSTPVPLVYMEAQ